MVALIPRSSTIVFPDVVRNNVLSRLGRRLTPEVFFTHISLVLAARSSGTLAATNVSEERAANIKEI